MPSVRDEPEIVPDEPDDAEDIASEHPLLDEAKPDEGTPGRDEIDQHLRKLGYSAHGKVAQAVHAVYEHESRNSVRALTDGLGEVIESTRKVRVQRAAQQDGKPRKQPVAPTLATMQNDDSLQRHSKDFGAVGMV